MLLLSSTIVREELGKTSLHKIIFSLVFMQWLEFAKSSVKTLSVNPANTYLFKVGNRNTRKTCKICSELKNSRSTSMAPFSAVSVVELEQVNVSWEYSEAPSRKD